MLETFEVYCSEDPLERPSFPPPSIQAYFMQVKTVAAREFCITLQLIKCLTVHSRPTNFLRRVAKVSSALSRGEESSRVGPPCRALYPDYFLHSCSDSSSFTITTSFRFQSSLSVVVFDAAATRNTY